MALTSLFEGISPEEFTGRVRDVHVAGPSTRRSAARCAACVYQPMLELIDELAALDVAVTIVSGGGTEFVRAVSQDLYGVPPEARRRHADRLRVRPRRRRRAPAAQDRRASTAPPTRARSR